MRKIATSAMFVFALALSVQGQSKKNLDSIYVYDRNDSEQTWQLSERIINDYNEENRYLGNTVFDWNETEKIFVQKAQNGMMDIKSDSKNRVQQKWDDQKNAWVDDKQFIFVYDDKGRKTETINQLMVDGKWINQFEDRSVFCDEGLLVEKYNKYYNQAQGRFTVNQRSTFGYDNGKLTNKTEQNWDEETDSWINIRQTVYRYNDESNGQISGTYQQIWNNAKEAWQTIFGEKYVYSDEGNLNIIETDFELNADKETLKKGRKSVYTYLEDGSLSEKMVYQWINQNQEWVNSTKSWFEKNADGRLTEEGYLRWDIATGKKVDGHKDSYVFDGNKKMSYKTEVYRAASASWTPVNDQTFKYDEDNFQIESYFKQWDYNSGDLTKNRKYERFWNERKTDPKQESPIATKTEQKTMESSAECVVPNPYKTGNSIFCTGLKADNEYQLSVYDMNGQTLSRQLFRGSDPTSINQNLPTGIYIFKIEDHKGPKSTHKIVIQ